MAAAAPINSITEGILFRIDDDGGRALRSLYRKVGANGFAARRAMRLAILADAADQWAEETADAPRGVNARLGAGEGETPILDAIFDFIRDILESGKIQEFLIWLFEALPKLIAAIVAIFV